MTQKDIIREDSDAEIDTILKISPKNLTKTPRKKSRGRQIFDISNIWETTAQMELYNMTRKPEPQVALKKGDCNKFHSNSAAYIWTNEPINSLEKIFKFGGKSCLGVAASGDQPLLLMNLGIKKYLGFDISQIACFWNELKTVAIKNLPLDDFLKFVDNENDSGLRAKYSEGVYHVIREDMTHYAREFFDSLVKENHKYGIYNMLGSYSYFRRWSHPTHKFLKDKQNYSSVQKKLENQKYKLTWQSLTEILDKTKNEKFDIIFLSNILDRWHLFGGNYTSIISKMKSRLVEGQDSAIIGNYQLGFDVADKIRPGAEKNGMVFYKEANKMIDRTISGAEYYWVIKYK